MSISGSVFEYDKRNPEQLKKQNEDHEQKIGATVPDFWRCINICHDVVQMNIKDKKGNSSLQLSGASQDEVTFLEMCRKVGYGEFIERDSKNIKIKINGNTEVYEILRVIDFDSVRKRMSIIVKNLGTNQVINFIKGADMAIEPRLSEASKTSDEGL
jgi:phospholipid-translocating ATPase